MPRKKFVSPPWTNSTKLIFGLTAVAVVAALLVRFNNLLAPLLFAFILSYLLHPLASRLSAFAKLPWRTSVNLIFIAFILIIISLSTLIGFAVVDQLAGLVSVLTDFVAGLPELARGLATQAVHIGPFDVNFANIERLLVNEFGLDFATLSQQVLAALQPVLGQAGGLIAAVATSALGGIGWSLFIFIIAYFLLAEAGQVPDVFKNIDLPAHDAEYRRMGRELGRIWNTFLRGQLLVIILIVITYFFVMSVLGIRYALGLAILTGLAKFVPYVGPLIAGTTTALVAFFQGGNYLGIEPPFTYALIAVVAALVMDQTFDNLIVPRIYGRALGVHPAAVLIAALIGARLLGLIGIVLAAPGLASLQLFITYATRKMLDLDPWPNPETELKPIGVPLARPLQRLIKRTRSLVLRLGKRKRRK